MFLLKLKHKFHLSKDKTIIQKKRIMPHFYLLMMLILISACSTSDPSELATTEVSVENEISESSKMQDESIVIEDEYENLLA